MKCVRCRATLGDALISEAVDKDVLGCCDITAVQIYKHSICLMEGTLFRSSVNNKIILLFINKDYKKWLRQFIIFMKLFLDCAHSMYLHFRSNSVESFISKTLLVRTRGATNFKFLIQGPTKNTAMKTFALVSYSQYQLTFSQN